VSTDVHGEGQRFVADPITGFPDPDAEINIFKPNRAKAFVEAPQAGPSLAPDEQEGAGGLLGIAGFGQIYIEAAPTAVDGVPRPDPVETHVLKGQCRRSGEAAQSEALLWNTIRLAERSSRNGGERIVQAADEWSEVGLQDGVGVEQQNEVS